MGPFERLLYGRGHGWAIKGKIIDVFIDTDDESVAAGLAG